MKSSQEDNPDHADIPVESAEPTQDAKPKDEAPAKVWIALLAVRCLKGFVTLVVLVSVVFSLLPQSRNVAPPVVAPSLTELNASLELSEEFLRPLNHVFPGSQGITSEFYGLPLRLRLGDNTWMYPGQSGVSVETAYKAQKVESENIEFREGTSSANVTLRTYWDASHWDPFRLIVEGREAPPVDRCANKRNPRQKCVPERPKSGSDIVVYVSLNAQLPDDQRAIASLGGQVMSVGGQGRTLWFRLLFERDDQAKFASWRYTIRHATANMREFSEFHEEGSVADALGNTMQAAGFRLGQDIYAPLWGSGTEYGDDMPYWPSSYRDCSTDQPSIDGFYPYRSKVCRLPLAGYRSLSATDTLLRAVQAVHVLNRHDDPDYRYSDLDHLNLTPASTARDLERTWVSSGIPQCNPAGCEQNWASVLRTAAFGTLETMLGYQHGDRDSRAWADTAARTLLRVQVGPGGWMQVLDRRYYRPLSTGSFYAVWDSDFHNNQSFSFVVKLLREQLVEPLDMPPEFTGIIPSNTESTMAAYAFLARYRCQRYGQGCGPDDVFGPATTALVP